MRKKRAKMLRKLANQELKQPEYKMLVESDPTSAYNRIMNGIKTLWYQGKI